MRIGGTTLGDTEDEDKNGMRQVLVTLPTNKPCHASSREMLSGNELQTNRHHRQLSGL
jgi:hypothetical protein